MFFDFEKVRWLIFYVLFCKLRRPFILSLRFHRNRSKLRKHTRMKIIPGISIRYFFFEDKVIEMNITSFDFPIRIDGLIICE